MQINNSHEILTFSNALLVLIDKIMTISLISDEKLNIGYMMNNEYKTESK
ncbi:hypothetical protein HYE11_00900 [Mycoplasmopsis bovis]|nr:hypothetical protein HYE11_00900 [Mycoplasmopsis bovis]